MAERNARNQSGEHSWLVEAAAQRMADELADYEDVIVKRAVEILLDKMGWWSAVGVKAAAGNLDEVVGEDAEAGL